MYVLVMGEWYPTQKSCALFVNELDPLIAAQYPELYLSESESQSGSPMSQAGRVTEGESFSVGDGENSLLATPTFP